MMLFHALFTLGTVLGAAIQKRAAPSDDAFYTAPENLTSYRPGEIIDSRSVFSSVILREVTQIKYATTNTQNSSSYTIATVASPDNIQYPQKLLSIQNWQDSAGKNCVPSYGLVTGLLGPGGFTTSIIDMPIVLEWALSKGYYVVVPDHEGPNGEFIVGHTEGQAGLDGIRAAISYLNLSEDTDTALYGYSGGSHATAWMANLHEFYAPEINIVGSVTGGTVIDMYAMYNKIAGTVFSGFIFPVVNAFADAYPEQGAQVLSHFNGIANATLSYAAQDNVCIIGDLLGGAFRNIGDESDLDDFLSFPPLVDIFNRESLLNNVSSLAVSAPKFPRFNYHALLDEIVPYPADEMYTEQQCALGADIQFQTFDLGGHATTMLFGLPGALQFLEQAFLGEVPKVQCGSQNPQSVNMNSSNVDEVIGKDTADRIRAFNGKNTTLGMISW